MDNIIAQVQVFIMCNINLCVKHFAIFHASPTLVEHRGMIASLNKIRLSKGGGANNQSCKGNS